MAHQSKIFNKVPIEVQNRSGFDMSHEVLATAKCGQLVPLLCEPILPNDRISLGHFINVQLPPMATDFFGRVDAKLEAFFVPSRILYGGFQHWLTGQTTQSKPGGSQTRLVNESLPYVNVQWDTQDPDDDPLISKFGPGSLGDFLGVKGQVDSGNPISVLPFVAYHKIYDDWYRDSRLQRPIFTPSPDGYQSDGIYPSFLPYISIFTTENPDVHYITSDEVYTDPTFSDGVSLFDLRQRNYARDYFTNATYEPQAGSAQRVTFDTSGSTGGFSIATLRAANSLQQFLERNNIAGERYADQIKAQFGIYPSDAITDRAIYLGSSTINVYNRSVFQSATGSSSTKVPFEGVGVKYASSQAVGDNSLVGDFTATEHGFLFVMFSLVPHAYYSTGQRRYLSEIKVGDYPFPLLAGVGDQEILQSEITAGATDPEATFGYTQRYAHYKYHDDSVHGLLRDGQSLSAFALKRGFSGACQIGSNFIQIPQDALDEVTAAEDAVSDYGCWIDNYFKFHISRALPAYSIPTLGDPKDTHTEIVDNGGKRL